MNKVHNIKVSLTFYYEFKQNGYAMIPKGEACRIGDTINLLTPQGRKYSDGCLKVIRVICRDLKYDLAFTKDCPSDSSITQEEREDFFNDTK